MSFFSPEDARALLRNWERLNAELLTLPIEGVQELLEEAVRLKRGKQLVERVYMRYSRLRRIAEVKALLDDGVLPWKHQRQLTSKLKASSSAPITHLLRQE
jgi:hypothetical protein